MINGNLWQMIQQLRFPELEFQAEKKHVKQSLNISIRYDVEISRQRSLEFADGSMNISQTSIQFRFMSNNNFTPPPSCQVTIHIFFLSSLKWIVTG